MIYKCKFYQTVNGLKAKEIFLARKCFFQFEKNQQKIR